MKKERKDILSLIDEAQEMGARLAPACNIIGMSAKTAQRWRQSQTKQDGRQTTKREPVNKLTEIERQRIVTISNEVKYAHLPPSKIVPLLADKGRYIASESSFYRVLKAEKLLEHRQKSKPAREIIKPKVLTATGPNQVYSWDITYLPTRIRGLYFYLYLVMDIYSRKIVGWQVNSQESSALAADMIKDICDRESVSPHQVTLHSDNGSPMKGATMLATLQELGIIPSFNRPSVSNDNPYSESLFRTLKYRPEYPERALTDILAARSWVSGFVDWYNQEHLHSVIKFVTPEQRHKGEDAKILRNRKRVYLKARSEHPERWSGNIRNWNRVQEVYLNPEKHKPENEKYKAA